jgi:MoxR-like ATPase
LPDAWKLKVGTNCVVAWPYPPDPVTIDGKARLEKIIIDIAAGETDRTPLAGQRWLCRITANQPGISFNVKPLKLVPALSLANVWLSEVNRRLINIVLASERCPNLMMIGKQGCGKTTIGEAIAQHKSWQFGPIAGNTIKKYVFLLGQNIPILVDGEQRFRFEKSSFVKLLDEARLNPGKTYFALIDEINRIDEKGQDLLLNVVAGKLRVLTLPNGEVVQVPANIRWSSACNEGSAFAVTKSDAASKDRWIVVKIGYMPKQVEIEHCLRFYPQCPEAPLAKAIEVINFLRRREGDIKLRLSKSVSTRCAENTAMFLAEGIDLETALVTAVANQYEGSANDPRCESGRVAAVISDQLSA